MISAPCFVVSVTFVILSLVFGRSAVVSGRCGPDAGVLVRTCFGRLPSEISSGTDLLGDGSGCLVWSLVGAVAIGELAAAGLVVVDAAGASAIARGGSCGLFVAAVSSAADCCVEVCVSVCTVDLLGGLKTIG